MSDINDISTWEENEVLWNILSLHRGHRVEIATYGDFDKPADICLECMSCNEVLLDAEIYTICTREDAFKSEGNG